MQVGNNHLPLGGRQLIEISPPKTARKTTHITLSGQGKNSRYGFYPFRPKIIIKYFLEFAYQDKPFPIGSGQTISQPYTVAFQTELLVLKKGEKVLEIGTGSGYQACVLVEMGAKVFSVERQKKLYDRTRNLLPKVGYRPRLFYGDGYKGLPTFAPFDKILITAAAPEIPDELIQQLKPGGRLVIPVGSSEIQQMLSIDKESDGSLTEKKHGTFRFVPLLGDRADD